MLSLLFSTSLSLTLGCLLIACLSRTPPRHFFDRLLTFSLGMGLGLGLSACIFFVGLLICSPSGSGSRIFDTAIHLGLIIGLLLIHGKLSGRRPDNPLPDYLSGNPVLYYLFCASLVVSVMTLGLMAVQSPYGGQDALSIWNLRARILLKSQGLWLQDLTTIGQHPDYPLLLPALVARSWSYFGRNAWWIPFVAQGFMLYGAILGLTALIANLRGARLGLLAGWVLLGTPFFLRESAGLQADVTVAYYILAGVGMIGLKECCYPNHFGLEAAAGLMAALAAWTKNEGLLFLVVLLMVRPLMLYRRQGMKAALHSLSALAMGMLPVLILIVYFKLQIAPENDLVSGQSIQATLTRISDPSRYGQIMAAFFHGLLAFDRWQIYPLLLAAYMGLNGITHRTAHRFAGMTILAVILTVIGGYFCVYLSTPHDLHWHLKTALHRLLLQVWPATLLTAFLLVRKARPDIAKKAGNQKNKSINSNPANPHAAAKNIAFIAKGK